MSVVLSEHLPLLASAPDGIQKLRGLILELAVRGKLVSQDPNDEPASGLLKRIAEERGRLETEGTFKKSKAKPICREEQPFKIPNGWAWIRLTNLGEFRGGKTPSTNRAEYWDGTIPWVSPKDMKSLVVSKTEDYVSDLSISDGLSLIPAASVLIVVRSGILRRTVPVAINSLQCTVNQDLKALCFVQPDMARYVQLLIRGFERLILATLTKVGTTVESIKFEEFSQQLFPLPPLAEQHRIVAKVDELMALCDRLEAEQADAASAHARLVEALLGTLTQSTAAADLAANWQRLAEHFDTLFTTEASIDALKQTVLQLAVMGKLVPQESTCSDEMTCFEGDVLPTGWRIESINEFCNVQGGIQKTPLRRPVKNHYPYLRVANVQRGSINTDELARYELTAEELVRWRLDAGDLLIVEGNGSESEIGRCAVWRGQIPDCVYQNHLIRVRPHVPEQVDYLQLFLNSPVGIGHMKRLAITTSGLFNLSVGKIRGIEVPLPPLAEQHRIVAKVDELMALCDRLKADLATARQHQATLADTLIDAALEAA